MYTVGYFCLILTKTETVRQFSVKFRNIKFHEYSISSSRSVKPVQAEVKSDIHERSAGIRTRLQRRHAEAGQGESKK